MKYILFLFPLYFCFNASLAKVVVNDITNINPIKVSKVIVPITTDQIKEAIKKSKGPISIGGGRYSMGGQTATEDTTQIDMRSFNKILNLDLKKKQITVQAGIRWREIHEEIDKHDLSMKIMQSYSNFTVGGSLSVNAHGRYLGEGPIIGSVESIKLILANGDEMLASINENSELFYSAIGGYGGVGVITEATLNLVSNEKIEKQVKLISADKYKSHFMNNIKNDKNAVLHSGAIYPPDYNNVSLETWYRTDKPLTVSEKLIPKNQTYWVLPNIISFLSIIPYGSEIRRNIFDPINNNKKAVFWRNYEASYDVAALEPSTPRIFFTYVLQEYFIPVDKFDEFISKMRKVFKNNNVNVINVSIRHAQADTGSYLSWAPEEMFCFVVYYKQRTSASAQTKVKKWSREMIDEVISVSGKYYLPYQIHATNEQFKKAYPNHTKFFEVKKKYDPDYRFRNKLWDKYNN